MKRLPFAPYALLLAAAIVLSGAVACDRFPGKGHAGFTGHAQNASASIAGNPALGQALGSTAISDAAEKTIDSVVNISSTRIVRTSPGSLGGAFDDPFFRRFFGQDFGESRPREQKQSSLGSGVIVDADGTILTNNHVVEGASELKVTLRDDRTYTAKVVGADPSSDLAVIRIQGKAKDLKPLPIGDSDRLRLGEIVLAIGNPFGLDHTVTMGIVSAKGRNKMGLADYEDFIQTDAAINPGNSGGALINLRGELVGVNTAITSQSGGSQGVGFAIPSNMARTIMAGLEGKGKIVRGYLGVSVGDVTPEVADALGLKSGNGALVNDVLKDSPGKRAGLQHGDVILALNGDRVENSGQLRNRIALLGADKTVKLRVLRNGREQDVSVRLAARPNDERTAAVEQRPEEGSLDGIEVASLSGEMRQSHGIPTDVRGVVVTDIREGSPAGDAGLQPGFVIREVNRRPVESVAAFTGEYRKARGPVLLYVWREGASSFLVVKK